MARCLERPTVDPLFPQRAIIDELLFNAAATRVRADAAVVRATAAMNRAKQLMKEMRRLRAQANAAPARHDRKVAYSQTMVQEQLSQEALTP